MQYKFISFVLAVFFMLTAAGALAQSGSLIVENNTRMDIVELYPSNLDTGAWDKDLLNGKILGFGDQVTIELDPRVKMLDLRAIFANGTDRNYYGINVRQYPKIRLNTMDSEPF